MPQVAHRGVGALAVGLVDDEHVADLEDARLGRLDTVAHPGREQDDGRVGEARDLDLGLADADRLDHITSHPAASSTRIAWGVVHDNPPRCPREAIERMYTSGSSACSCMRTRSPSSAPPENGEDGSTARIPTRLPRARYAVTRLVEVDLPTPGEPVSPMMWALWACGANAAITSRSDGWASSTSEIEACDGPRRAGPGRGDQGRHVDRAGRHTADQALGTRTTSASP